MPSTPVLAEIETIKVSEMVYRILREGIIGRQFLAGQRLDVEEIENQLGISRTPVKEALNRLALEGLVEIIPRRGTYVADPGAEDIGDSFEVRKALEIHAVGLVVDKATEHELRRLRSLVEESGEMVKAQDQNAIYLQYVARDHQFHQELVALSGNKRLMVAHEKENVHAQMARVRYRSEKELDLAQEEHERIMAALEARDRVQAQREMAAHLERAKRSLLTDMVRQPGGEAGHSTPDPGRQKRSQ